MVAEFKSILELIQAFPDEQACIDHLEKMRWDGYDMISPFDPSSKVYDCKGNKYKCKNTGKYFNVKTNTLFDSSKVPLQKWFIAIYLVTGHKKGISSMQLSRDIDVTQKTAWFVLQRIRNCFGIDNDTILEGEIEADETFVHGKNKNHHADKKIKNCQGRSFKDNTPVLGLLQRGTEDDPALVKLFVISNTSKADVQPILGRYVKKGSKFYSDEWNDYRGLSSRYNHHFVDHTKKVYVDHDSPEIRTNTIEGFWSILKRGVIRVYHCISRKHIQKYANEFAFRYNTRKSENGSRFELFMSNMENRLTYKALIDG